MMTTNTNTSNATKIKSTFGASAAGAYTTTNSSAKYSGNGLEQFDLPGEDPYVYQSGFGNRFESEALPGTLPRGQSMPQKNKYDLYHEGLTGSSFIAPRLENLNTMVYRIRPSVAHQGFERMPDNPDLESTFLPINPKVHVSPTQLAWRPFPIPSESGRVDFVDGLKTIAGNGDPTLHEGLAIHVYLANTSMDNRAFCNTDGEMLFVPQQGRVELQTEFGWIMVRPGEIAVVPRGIKIRVLFPDGPSRGYVQELYGSRYELPELGIIGSHGLANPRDFESPVASFDIDQSPWKIVYKVGGQLHQCSQNHTPFDVVAWHGNYLPYKYNLTKFINVGSISRDHIDPSCFCVLTAKSKRLHVPLADFLIFSPRWEVSSGTFRPPYYHRNAASEFMGMIYGEYAGRSDEFQPGGASFETGFCPHGVSYEVFEKATEAELKAERVHEGTMAFMFESSTIFTLTDYAMKRSGVLHQHDPKMWDNLKGRFMDHLEEINADLKALGRPALNVREP